MTCGAPLLAGLASQCALGEKRMDCKRRARRAVKTLTTNQSLVSSSPASPSSQFPIRLSPTQTPASLPPLRFLPPLPARGRRCLPFSCTVVRLLHISRSAAAGVVFVVAVELGRMRIGRRSRLYIGEQGRRGLPDGRGAGEDGCDGRSSETPPLPLWPRGPSGGSTALLRALNR